MAEEMITFEVFRYQPESGAAPTFQNYEAPYRKDWVVLDALNWIKDNVDGTLSYRWSCRMGVCGSCGMMVNGEPKLTCAAFLKDYAPGPIRVEPLAHFAVERDLIIYLEDFLDKLRSVKPFIVRKTEKALSQGEYLQTPAELAKYKQYSMCINCMLCYAACPVMGLQPHFIGPAALALAERYNLDSRDQGKEERMDVVASAEGIWECTFVGECSVVCPKNVDPAGAIQQTKVETMMGLVLPRGTGS
jgi:fumarate reductase iron-sulfur subunit